jgi:hypothetical protein
MDDRTSDVLKVTAIMSGLNPRSALIPKLRAMRGHGTKMSIAEASKMFADLARAAEIYGRIVGASSFLSAVDRFLEDLASDIVAALTLAVDPVLDGASADDPALVPFDPPTIDEISRHFLAKNRD